MILLNSLWGKFAQRASHSEVIYTTTAEDFNAKIWDPRYDVLDILNITERVDIIVQATTRADPIAEDRQLGCGKFRKISCSTTPLPLHRTSGI